MKAFVTGGTGFIGSHLVSHLLDQQFDVVCLARSRSKAKRVFADRIPELIIGDMENTEALEAGCSGTDVVFHLAGIIAARSEAEFFRTNAEATRKLARAAANQSSLSRILYVSSLAAAGPTRRGLVVSDPSASDPVTDYGRSKLAGEDALRGSTLPWTIVRPPAVYGPGDRELLRVFKLARLGIIPIFGDGSQELSLVHAKDLARAILAAAVHGSRNTTYYPAHREIVTSRQLVETIFRAVKRRETGSPRLIKIPQGLGRLVLQVTGAAAKLTGQTTILSPDKGAEFFAPAWTCDPSKLADDTGWSAEYDAARGIAETTDWYRSQRWL